MAENLPAPVSEAALKFMTSPAQSQTSSTVDFAKYAAKTWDDLSSEEIRTLPFAVLFSIKKRERDKRIAEVEYSIRRAYGEWLSDWEVWDIDRVHRENEICERCKGECLKPRNKNHMPFYRTDEKSQSLYYYNPPCDNEKTRLEARKFAERLKFADIPKQYSKLTFDNYLEDKDNRLAKQVAQKIVETGRGGAFFYGSFGVGKTMLAAIIANESVKRGRKVIFSQVPNLMRNVRATFNNKSEVTEAQVLMQIAEIPVLILDDVRRDGWKKFAGDTLFDILDHRYASGLQTIITSNGTLEEVADALNNPTDTNGILSDNGSRIYDRCKTMMPPIEIKGGSRRK